MKTVWHRKNILKASGCVLITAALCGAISLFCELSITESLLLGVVTGFATMKAAMLKWDLYHYEF